MPSIHRVVLAVLLLSAVVQAHAAALDAAAPVNLAVTSRIYVTLVPHNPDDDAPRWIEASSVAAPALNLALRTARRNRLEFSLAQRDLLTQGDQLQLRLASHAHLMAQLLSGGQFSEEDD